MVRNKKYFFFYYLLFCVGTNIHGEVKTIQVSAAINVEECSVKETVICNLTEECEIFNAHPMFLIDGHFYLARRKPVELIKLSLNGKLIRRIAREGQGPGEILRVWAIREFKGNLALLDYKKRKMILYSKDLKFLNEYKLNKAFMGFLVDESNRFILYGEPNSSANYYFSVFSEDCQFLRAFGETKGSSLQAGKKRRSLDSVRRHLYIPGKNGLWCCFMNRYDLQYYINEKLSVEIKAPKDFFKGKIVMGERHSHIEYNGRSVQLARSGNLLYYFFRLKTNLYCDTFELNTFRFQRRKKLNSTYVYIIHSNANIFYSLGYQLDNEDDEHDVVLYKFKL